MSAAVTVWSQPSCVQCTATYRKLNEKDIPHEVMDLTAPENAKALEDFKARGFLRAPIITVGDDIWSGFRPDLIDALADQLQGASS